MSRATEPTTEQSKTLNRFYEPVAEPLAQVEALLRKEMHHPHPSVDAMTQHGFRLGGKRLRPALLLLTARAVGAVSDAHVTLGAVVEMIHTATLVHDDVLDGASVRRYQASANERWGNRQSVLLGDYLFSHAFYLASTLESTLACQVIGRTTNRVCEGEICQNDTCGDWTLSEADYLELIDAKTAELCACCCQLGAHYAGAAAAETRRWTEYGRCVGMAFQIVDDILDISGQQDETGKSLGTDLEQHKPTLPIIRALQLAGDSERCELESCLAAGAVARTELLGWLERFDAINYATSRAIEFADRAAALAADSPASPAQQVLETLPVVLMQRRA